MKKMLEFLKKIFAIIPEEDFKDLMNHGAMIIDVRTNIEFQREHIPIAQNFPLHKLDKDCSRIKKERIIITCCATGLRSSSAMQLLKAKGYGQVYNGGDWKCLLGKLL